MISAYHTSPQTPGTGAAAEARLVGEAPRAPGGEESAGGEPGRCVASAAAPAPGEPIIITPLPFCPDLFGLHCLGEADGPRGRIVRAFAWLIDRVWPTK